MSLQETLSSDLKSAMKNSDQATVGVLRMVISVLKNKGIEKAGKGQSEQLTDEEVMSVILSEAKKRKDSIDAFVKGGRQDLADKEKAELELMQKYLPKQMSRAEVEKAIGAIVAKLGSKEMGPVMKAVMAELRGKADSSVINEVVREKIK